MQLLKTVNPKNVDETSISDWQYRKAARAVVFDNNNQIGLLYVKKKNYYKLPGGGVETGEDAEAALRRECKEELGVEIRIIKEVGGIVEYRSKWKLCQTSYCFIAKIDSEKNNPNFTEKEKLSGFEIVWAVIIAGAPFVGLHWGVVANRIKKYGVYVRSAQHTAFDILFGVVVAFAIEICFSYMNSIGVNLVIFTIGIGVEIILLRWCLYGKSPTK